MSILMENKTAESGRVVQYSVRRIQEEKAGEALEEKMEGRRETRF